jgi:hypothetical protein
VLLSSRVYHTWWLNSDQGLACAGYYTTTKDRRLCFDFVGNVIFREARGHILPLSSKIGRTRPAKKQHTKATNPPLQHSKPPSILEKAQELIVHCDYELALRFARRILEQQPENVETREMLGVSLLEMGDVDAAKHVSVFCDRSCCS